MIGRQISHFYLIGKLGSGGMADVYEAQDLRLPRTVALKFLKAELSKDPLATKRFNREARLAASLNHPNICTILDVDENGGHPFIAMELLQGQSLKELLRAGPLSPPDLFDIAAQTAEALSAAHTQRIVHRDVTPGNIFVTLQRVVKMLDFGLAKVFANQEVDDHVTDAMTEPGSVAGTVHYLSPEHLDGRQLDHRCDLFALGTVLYEAAAGTRPFESRSRAEVIAQIRACRPIPLRHLAPQYPAQFEQIVGRLLDPDRENRYQRASDVLKDLDRLRDAQRSSSPSAAHIRTRQPAGLSVAVVPFTIAGDDDAALRAFRDGLVDDVSWWLQKIRGVRVAPRTSTDSLRGLSIHALAEQLKVDTVLEGSIQRSGVRLRVIFSLLNGATEEALRPAMRVDITCDDLLVAQDDAARRVVAGVKATVARARIGLGTRSGEAHFEYQRGLHYMKDVFGGGWNRVIDHATRAIEYDPKFAPGYVLLADAYNFLGLLSLMKPRLAFTKARQAAERALKLDDELAAAHAALALVQFAGDWDWEGAETSFRRALDIDEDLAVARIHYSWLLGLLERSAAAFEEADAALATSKSRIVMAGAALTYFMAERYDEAIELCDRCLRIDGNVIFATYLRGQCYHMQQRYDVAQVDLERAALLGNRAPFYLGLLGKSYGEAGQRQAALRVVEELDGIAATHYVAPHCYVYILHGLGERERALEHQEQAYEDGAPPLNYLTPYIRHLFSLDPKHRDRLRQMRLDV